MLANAAPPNADTMRFSAEALAAQPVNPKNASSLMSDPTMVAAMQKDKPVAANYPATLTEEQTEAIKNKYDIENLKWPSKESAALGEELFSLGVIDDQQRKFFYGAVKYQKGPYTLGELTVEGKTPSRQTHYEPQESDSMIDILLGELAVQQKNLDFMQSPDSPEKRIQMNAQLEDGKKITMEERIAALEEYMGQYQSMYDLLAQFM
jgi:hypothetical protein